MDKKKSFKLSFYKPFYSYKQAPKDKNIDSKRLNWKSFQFRKFK